MFNLITILGPTATGKTRLAVLLAAHINGEIISADSRQVYRGMNIGTGKDINEYTVNGKTVPHFLIDIVNPGYEYNVFEFQNDFIKVFNNILRRKKQPLLCGGSGLYLESILSGYNLNKVNEDIELRNKLEKLSDKELISILKKYGNTHNTTDMTNRQRTIRAIEIRQHQLKSPVKIVMPKINSLNIGLKFERNIIRTRITQRLKQRLENGMIEEVKQLLDNGLKPEQLSFYGLEYRFVTQYVTGKTDYQTMFNNLNTAIHQFSKRQMTWFRRMEKKGITIHWIEGVLSDNEKLEKCLKLM